MFGFSIVMLAVSGILLIAAALLFWVYRIFEYNPEKTAKVLGVLVEAKYKKDVPVYERNGFRAPGRRVMTVKNMTKGVYGYTVDGKRYRIRFTELVKRKNMPESVWVVYLKAMPRIAYVKSDVTSPHFEIYAIVALGMAVMTALAGLGPICM